jgi:uncharacterized protein (DUF305 family)
LFYDEKTGESQWWEIRFALMWIQHGGSGLGMSYDQVNDLDVMEIAWLVERMHEQRKIEVEAMKRANRSR